MGKYLIAKSTEYFKNPAKCLGLNNEVINGKNKFCEKCKSAKYKKGFYNKNNMTIIPELITKYLA